MLWKEQKKIINFTFTAFFNKEATKIPVDNPITMKKDNLSPALPLPRARHLLQVKSILQFIGDKTPVLIWQSQEMSSSTRRNRVAFSDSTSSSALSLEISSASAQTIGRWSRQCQFLLPPRIDFRLLHRNRVSSNVMRDEKSYSFYVCR